MARIIQLRPQGGTKRRYGSFVGRAPFIPPPVTQVTSPDVSGHGRPDRWERGLSPRELAELNIAEAFRNTPEPAKTDDTRTPKDIPGVSRTVPEEPKVVRLDDYRSPSLNTLDAAIKAANEAISALLDAKLAKDANEKLIIQQIADMEEELAITLLLLD